MAQDFLYADKKIYDSVHGFISFDELEKELIDSIPFQRLHYIHQLGIAYMVYPGATHTRFEHSLGVMALASAIFEKVCRSVRPDVFHFVPRKGSSDYLYWRRVLRLAALCHDLGHLPFSHAAESDLIGAEGHEEWTLKIIDSPFLKPVWDKLRATPAYLKELIERDIVEDIKKIAIGEKHWKALTGRSLTPWEKIVSQVITGEFFGADRIDYLLRDAKSTGVAYGLFDYHQLIETLRVLPSVDHGTDELQLGIDENGLESCEALLLARHFMHRRIYQYSSVRAYHFHLRRFLRANKAPHQFRSVEDFLSFTDTEIIANLRLAAKDSDLPGHTDAACIMYRQHRFRAIALSAEIQESDLERFKTEQNLTGADIEWEFVKEPPAADRFSFPVVRKQIVLRKACDCSDLLLNIPAPRTHWVYIAPEHDLELVRFLEDWGM
jgi:hypothetical protein